MYYKVAPHVGAWIETLLCYYLTDTKTSHPMWVRGLKPIYTTFGHSDSRRTPCGCVD